MSSATVREPYNDIHASTITNQADRHDDTHRVHTNGSYGITGVDAKSHNNKEDVYDGLFNDIITSGVKANMPFKPIAICGMACRLPGGIHSPSELWSFILAGLDARTTVPATRYNIAAYHSPVKKPGTTVSQHGYFLDPSNELGALDSTFFSMPRSELEGLDPQQRMLLEVARESLDDSGDTSWKGGNVGVYVGSYGQDWYDVWTRDTQAHGIYQVLGTNDFMISNRLSHELDLRGPSMTIRTACSASLIGLNEACMALSRGDCTSALVGGTNIIMAPGFTTAKSEQGILSPDGSCKTFSANVDGYARGEGIVAIYVKSLADALRDGNPVRAVISGSATNSNGKTRTVSMPSAKAQEALIRRAYYVAGIPDIARTGFFECHGTGTKIGDPIETQAVASCFGKAGVHIGSVKANLGHAEGASGLVAILKAVLALEHRTIPPNIKCMPLNPAIPFESANLIVPTKPIPWPEGRDERVSINNFGLGGSNAHVIIESAANFAANHNTKPRETSNRPHLLLFSAKTPASLQIMVEKYKTFLTKVPESLPDLAYTLANKREHFAHRAFAVCTNEEIAPAVPASPIRTQAAQTTSLVMVFTGQGAQWAQMGLELFSSNMVFQNTITSLDRVLQQLGPFAPAWSITEELCKSERESRIDKAEFSQPLTTALQIALVDTYASIGIRPAAVLGHSSGEVAAAYTAGGLSSREAIIVAFLRGLVTTRQTRKGAMAALGLSWEDAERFLMPGVMLACDNSPKSVTISGDAEPVLEVVRTIKESSLGALVTVLKVDKAYHSHHMIEVGGDCHAAMTEAGVVGGPHVIPFFSSVTGGLLRPTKQTQFGPQYWQKNLESPVLFKTAVTSAVKHQSGSAKQVFLEVGPHSVLAGPLRQILAYHSNDASYVPTLVRRKDSAESYLAALGQLFNLHVPIDFKSLMPTGRTLSDLPPYPWDHHSSYWSESRVANEWRMCKHRHHDLLGAKIPESTDLEPVWRNLLHIDNVLWLRDHKINSDIVFPFAAYIAMSAEAICQVTGVTEAVEFRNVAVPSALVITEGKPKELVTSLRRHRLTDCLDSKWWEFSIASYNGHTWTRHCTGEIQAKTDDSCAQEHVVVKQHLPRIVSSKRWYDAMRREGLDYGLHFESLKNIATTTISECVARADVRNNWYDGESYHLHPIILESCFQLLSITARYGLTHDYHQVIPASVASLTIRRSAADNLVISALAEPQGLGVSGLGSVVAGDKTVIKVSGVRLLPFVNGEARLQAPITARCEWVKKIDTEPLNHLVKPIRDCKQCVDMLNDYTELSILASKRSLTDLQIVSEYQRYKVWLDKFSSASDVLDDDALASRIGSLADSLARTPVAPVVKAISIITTYISVILTGEKNVTEVLNVGDILSNFKHFIEGYDRSLIFSRLAHNKPNLRVLELNAGIGSATAEISTSLTHHDGQALYSRYVVCDPSSEMVDTLQTHFQSLPNMEFMVFDISKAIEEQNFGDKDFDLVIAVGVIHSTQNLEKTLRNVRKLLAPTGRLLLQSLRPDLIWARYVLGLLPEWSCGIKDGRVDEPYLSLEGWENRLSTAGLQTIGGPALDSREPFHISHVIMAKPQRSNVSTKKITILSDCSFRTSHPLVGELISRGYDVSHCTLTDVPPKGQDILSLLDRQTPFLENIGSTEFNQLKVFVKNLVDAGLMWITQPTQGQCVNPGFAQIYGLARCIRSEMNIRFATCETDDMESFAGCQALAGVFQSFSESRDVEEYEQEFEYVIADSMTYVNRIFPFSFDNERAASGSGEDARLTINRPRQLETLHWISETAAELQGDEVRIDIYASSLNLRDIFVATGTIELNPPTFGYEASGIVSHVGPNVTKVAVGDRVMVMGFGLLASTVTISELLCEKLPSVLDFSQGASIPLVFVTAIHSLVNVGDLKKGQSVLIHSGCGGVGLAAIQLARILGAEIYTTVSSDEKINFLVKEFGIPRRRIFNSHSAAFANKILMETNNRGVDLALNSLSGELLHETWRCIAKWGTMVEIGRSDMLGAGTLDMKVFLANRSYRCVDIDQMCRERPQAVSSLLQTMTQLLHQGQIKPIRVDKAFSASEIQGAFRYMQQGSYVGKIIIEFRKSNSPGLQLGKIRAGSKDKTVKLDSLASYLLVGGFGGLGRFIAVWMVQHGARNLIFLSRKAGSTNSKTFIEEIESMGCAVQVVRGSVTNTVDVARAVTASRAPLKGILQMSMVLQDRAWQKMTIGEWNNTVAPKVQGTWNLHHETQSQRLDFFILFSSLSGIVGQPGQANYASANTFLDAFVRYRTSRSLPCTSINIGAVEGVGYLANNDKLLRKMKGTGWRAVQETELLETLGNIILTTQDLSSHMETSSLVNPHHALLGIAPYIPLSSPESSSQLRKDVRMSVYYNIHSQSGKGVGSNNGLQQFLAAAKANPETFNAPESMLLLSREIGKKLFSLVLQPVDGEIDTSLSMVQIGLDSMVAVEMRAWLKQVFKLDISILEMLSMATLEALGKQVARGLTGLYT